MAGRGTTTGARREGGGESNPLWPRRRRWGAGGGDEDGERVRERVLARARLLITLWGGFVPLGPAAFDEPAASLPIQNSSSARAWLSSSAIASRVMVLRFLWPIATSPSFFLLLRPSSSSDSGSGTS